MTHLKDSVQESVVDGCGGTNCPVGKEESSEARKNSAGHSNGAVHCEVELHIGADVIRRQRLHRGGQWTPALVVVDKLFFVNLTSNFF